MAFGPWQFGTTEFIALIQTGAVLLIAWWAKESVEHWIKKRATIRKSEVAEKCLALMYEADDVFQSIRSPFDSMSIEEARLEGVERINMRFNRGLSRVDRNKDFYTRIYKSFALIKTILGEKISYSFQEITILRNLYMFALRDRKDQEMEDYHSGGINHLSERERQERKKIINKYNKIIYGAFSDKDAFHQRYLKALKELENELLPLIRGEEKAIHPSRLR